MQEIADEAGVNKALLHYYFRSKERLSAAVFQLEARALFVPMVGLLSSDAPLEDKVARFVSHQLDRLSRSPFVPAYLLAEMNHYPERLPQMMAAATGLDPQAAAKNMLAVLERQIEERVAAGEMRPIPAEHFLVSLVSLCIFPFAARPMVCFLLGLDPEGYARFIEERRTELPAFVTKAVRA
jgi:TetR/AcrR family transcriptional regulator